jgi:hypothetical protein
MYTNFIASALHIIFVRLHQILFIMHVIYITLYIIFIVHICSILLQITFTRLHLISFIRDKEERSREEARGTARARESELDARERKNNGKYSSISGKMTMSLKLT